MDPSNYEIVLEMYNELKKEQASRLSSLHEKKNDISEIDVYLNSLLNKEESDFQVFFPRKVEDVYSDVIEENELRKKALIAECDELEKQFHLDKDRLEKLEKILSDTSMFHVKQPSILDAQERERQRIAKDLKYTSLNLTHLVHKVELSKFYVDEDPAKAKSELAMIDKGIRKEIEKIRNNIFYLTPMSADGSGLRESIEELFSVLNQDKKFYIEADIDDIDITQSHSSEDALFISIYRIIQECMQNAIKHSGGNKIIVKLKDCRGAYQICVQDNGAGFDVDAALKKDRHFGLSDIKERVLLLDGKINIDTQNGTLVDIIIPKFTTMI